MRATHFGAGNIGRGFIGEVLFKNNFTIDFVDINDTVIEALSQEGHYQIELADEGHERIGIKNVTGINSQKDPAAVIDSIASANIVTTAIGPTVLPVIAQLIAQGIQRRKQLNNHEALDVIACENMIGGSHFLGEEVKKWLDESDLAYLDAYVGFPNAAVDRIIPLQEHEDPLFVTVEPFSEWIIDQTAAKQKALKLTGVEYVADLQPYIERKLFSVNTGHATVAYTGAYYGCQTIAEALAHPKVLHQIEQVLTETGSLLIAKWGFEPLAHQAYTAKVIERFKNPYISDSIARVARTPIRKIGYDERFIRPIRELKAHGLGYAHLVAVTASILRYSDKQDPESVKLHQALAKQDLSQVIATVTGLSDPSLIAEIETAYRLL